MATPFCVFKPLQGLAFISQKRRHGRTKKRVAEQLLFFVLPWRRMYQSLRFVKMSQVH
jgi:hypothetical protein